MHLAYVPKAHLEVLFEDQADSVLLAQYVPLLLHKVADLLGRPYVPALIKELLDGFDDRLFLFLLFSLFVIFLHEEVLVLLETLDYLVCCSLFNLESPSQISNQRFVCFPVSNDLQLL